MACTSNNVHEERARGEKAFVLLDAIDKLCRTAGLDPFADALEIATMLQGWPESCWTELAVGCGKHPPSETTRSLIICRVRSRAEMH
jgi:hypothetical protein